MDTALSDIYELYASDKEDRMLGTVFRAAANGLRASSVSILSDRSSMTVTKTQWLHLLWPLPIAKSIVASTLFIAPRFPIALEVSQEERWHSRMYRFRNLSIYFDFYVCDYSEIRLALK